MRCNNCGAVLKSYEKDCPECKSRETEVQVLTPDEKCSFKGITIDQGQSDEGSYEYSSSEPHHRVYVRQVSFGSNKIGCFTKLAIFLVIAAIFLVALPLALFFIILGGITFWLIRHR